MFSLWFDQTEHKIYHTWGKHNNHYTIDVVLISDWHVHLEIGFVFLICSVLWKLNIQNIDLNPRLKSYVKVGCSSWYCYMTSRANIIPQHLNLFQFAIKLKFKLLVIFLLIYICMEYVFWTSMYIGRYMFIRKVWKY